MERERDGTQENTNTRKKLCGLLPGFVKYELEQINPEKACPALERFA